MKIESTTHNIILLHTDTQYELTSTFLRLQEFYECPNPKFRNKFFGLEDYMDWYAKEYGNFTYTSDWGGFNVPGDVVDKFFKLYKGKLLKKEQKLLDLILSNGKNMEGKDKFYIIGVHGDDAAAMDHEYAHAYYHLYPKYKKTMYTLAGTMPVSFRIAFTVMLKRKGYCNNVMYDEIQAYLSTNTMLDTVEYMKDSKVKIPWEWIVKFQEALHEHKESIKVSK